MNYSQVAKKVRERKEKFPEQYCKNPKCLWKTDSEYCPKHQVVTTESN